MKRTLVFAIALLVLFSTVAFASGEQEAGGAAEETETITLVGGTMLPEGHVYWRAMVKFSELLDEYYDGPVDVEFDMHHSGSIGTEKDMIEFMMQGVSVDFGVVSPAWAATWDETAPFIDAPFLFKSISHWENALEAGALDPIEDTMREKGVHFIGYGGGGARSLILNQPVTELEQLGDIDLRVQGSPLHARVFEAVGVNPTPLDYMEVYNAIKTGVVDGLENEPAGLEGMKFYEVAPYYVMTRHQITTRILAFSQPRLESFPQDLQDAIVRAGRDAGRWHRETEVAEAQEIIADLEENYGLTTIELTDEQNATIRDRAMPVVEDYAEEIGALDLFEDIQAMD